MSKTSPDNEREATGMLSFQLPADDLCKRLGDGIPEGSLIVVEGVHGAGKSVICQRIVQGLLRHDIKVGYVSTELTTKGMLKQMESLSYHTVLQDIPEERLVFVPTHPTIGARAPRSERLSRLLRARRLYELDVVVFDTFSKLLADHHAAHGLDGTDDVEAVLHLFKRLTGIGRSIILTLDPEQTDRSLVEPFIEAADCFLRIEKERVGTNTSRQIVVERMSRAARRYNEVIGFRVEPGVGIVIEIKAVVG